MFIYKLSVKFGLCGPLIGRKPHFQKYSREILTITFSKLLLIRAAQQKELSIWVVTHSGAGRYGKKKKSQIFSLEIRFTI